MARLGKALPVKPASHTGNQFVLWYSISDSASCNDMENAMEDGSSIWAPATQEEDQNGLPSLGFSQPCLLYSFVGSGPAPGRSLFYCLLSLSL